MCFSDLFLKLSALLHGINKTIQSIHSLNILSSLDLKRSISVCCHGFNLGCVKTKGLDFK